MIGFVLGSLVSSDYLCRMRLFRLKSVLSRYLPCEIIMLNGSGVHYQNIPDDWKVIKYDDEEQLSSYDKLIVEYDSVFNFYGKLDNVINFNEGESSYTITNEWSRNNKNDEFKFNLSCSLPITITHKDFVKYIMYPFYVDSDSEERIKYYYNFSGIGTTYPICFVNYNSVINLKHAFQGNLSGVKFEISLEDKLSGVQLSRSKYVIIDRVVSSGYIVDLLSSGMIPVLLDVRYPAICIDNFNSIYSGRLNTSTLVSKILRFDELYDSKKCKEFANESFNPLNIKELINWLK